MDMTQEPKADVERLNLLWELLLLPRLCPSFFRFVAAEVVTGASLAVCHDTIFLIVKDCGAGVPRG